MYNIFVISFKKGDIVMQIFTVSFFGHRQIDNFFYVESRVQEIIKKLIEEKEYVEFLIGRDGDFDRIVSSVISHSKKVFFSASSFHTCVLPYPRAEYLNNKQSFHDYYDDVEILDCCIHPKGAIQARNRMMVDRSNLCVFYVNKKGGAFQTMQYAKKKNVDFINISDKELKF